MTVARFTGDVRIAGALAVDGDLPVYTRSRLQTDTLKPYAVDLLAAKVHDAPQTNLPGTAADDDLAVSGTFGTNAIRLTAGDLKAAGATTRYARFQKELPAEYVDAGQIQLRISAGMLTTLAGTSATVDVVAYATDREGGISADLVATAAQSINSLTLADKDFVLTATGRAPGDMLDFRIAVAVTDAASGTAVEAIIAAIELLLDVRG